MLSISRNKWEFLTTFGKLKVKCMETVYFNRFYSPYIHNVSSSEKRWIRMFMVLAFRIMETHFYILILKTSYSNFKG